MRCAEARAGLWPPERPRLAGDEVVEAREHVRRCAACQSYLTQDRALLDAYHRMGGEGAPAQVRERVFDALALARAGGPDPDAEGAVGQVGPGTAPIRRWVVAGGGILAAAAALTLLALPGLEVPPPQPAGEVFVEDYLRRAVGEDHIRTTDASEVRRFLARELGMRVSPLQAEGLILEGAEICLLEGQRGAMIIYKKDGARISHYLVPRKGTRPRDPTLSVRPSRGEERLPVVTWSTLAVEEALVGDVPAEELLGLAFSDGAS